jgi:predicted NAD-dependent protein-ADP-ribosyltransferase YbiA (DUF1768 family)
MSVNTSLSRLDPNVTNEILNQTVDRAFRGYKEGACDRLRKSGLLNEEQMAKAENEIRTFNSDHSKTGPADLKNRLLAVLNAEVAQALLPAEAAAPSTSLAIKAQVLSPLPITHLCFPEFCASGRSNPFCSKKPFEFGKKYYTSLLSCVSAQQYTDQPDLMKCCAQLSDPEEIKAFVQLNPMTKKRKAAWENPADVHNSQRGVWMHACRAQFGQIHKLKQQLRDTCDLFLVCRGLDLVLSDGFDGTGQNLIGQCLMSLRKEYGGKRAVECSASYDAMIRKSQSSLNEFLTHPFSSFDVLEKILPWCEPSAVVALSCVNRPLRQDVLEWLSPEIAFKLCGSRVRIINTGSAEMPPFSPFELIKGCHKLLPLVEGDAGLTFLVMREGLTLRELVNIAADNGITVKGPCVEISINEFLKRLGDIPIRQTYKVLITNNVFKNSGSKSHREQKKLVREVGCEMPTIQEYVALCVFAQMIFKECLYGGTHGRSSTLLEGYPLQIGDFTPSELHIDTSGYDLAWYGAGGWWRKL